MANNSEKIFDLSNLKLMVDPEGPRYSLNEFGPREKTRHIAMVNCAEPDALKLAKRIVACVNACVGLKTGHILKAQRFSDKFYEARVELQKKNTMQKALLLASSSVMTAVRKQELGFDPDGTDLSIACDNLIEQIEEELKDV